VVDVLYIAVTVAFFALMVGFVRLCERVVGKDDVIDVLPDADADAGNEGDGDGNGNVTGTPSETPEEVPA